MGTTEGRRFQETSDGTQDVEVPAVFDLGLAEGDDCPGDLERWQEVRCACECQFLEVTAILCDQDLEVIDILCDEEYSHLCFGLQGHERDLADDICGIV